MVKENKRLVITFEFYRVNKTWLEIKAKKDEGTRKAIENLKSILKEKIEETENAIEIITNKLKNKEYSEIEEGHKKEHLTLLKEKLKYYKNL